MPKSTRAVAVAIPYICAGSSEDASLPDGPNELRFLVVSSRKHKGRYIFPKGGVEKGESGSEACLREAWEEAGLRGKVVSCIAEDIPSPRSLDNGAPKASYSIHLILVTSLEDDWPERHERDRKWVSLAEARELTTWREEMAICFDRIPSNLQELAQQP